jgi:hypothetical protein
VTLLLASQSTTASRSQVTAASSDENHWTT